MELLDHATDALKTAWKRVIGLFGNEIANEITKNSAENDSATDSQTEEIFIYTSWKRTVNCWWSKINIKF